MFVLILSLSLTAVFIQIYSTRPARLVERHLRLTLHSSLAGLGSLHAVLSKRRGKVVTDAMVDGTDLIQVTATIPQAESFVSFNSSLLLLL
jgi:translation elongation factor EF-G